MSEKISRRSVARGAVWATPVVLSSAAIPAYAASTTYSTDDIASVFTGYSVQPEITTGSQSNNCATTLVVDTTKHTSAAEGGLAPYLAPGFSIGVIASEADGGLVGQVATLNSLYYYVAVPKNLQLESLSPETASNWVLDGSYQGSPDNFPYENYSGNSIFDDAAYQEELKAYGGYNFFRFRYVGDTWALALAPENNTEGNSDNTWPGSPIKATFSGSAQAIEAIPGRLEEGSCLTTLYLASGYVFSANVSNTDVTFQNRTLARKDIVSE